MTLNLLLISDIALKVEEALDNVKIAIRNLKEFKTCFQEYKQKLHTYYPADVSPKLWEFQVFHTISSKQLKYRFLIRNYWYLKDLTVSWSDFTQ